MEQCAQRGILVLLDMHCLDVSGTDSSTVFFNSKYSIDDAVAGWVAMAQRYANSWNVFAIDVFNEPFGGTWNIGADTDMDAFSVRVAAAVHEFTDWLIFAEGTASSPNCTQSIDGDVVTCGYGDNLLGVKSAPVELGQPNKVVYSPHTYGPSQHDRAEFSNANFPDNMPDVWSSHWGYIKDKNTTAVVLGEWGGPTDGENGLWVDKLVEYLQMNGMQSNFFWYLNTDSNPAGLLMDWTAPDLDKLAVLETLTPSPTNITDILAGT